MPEVKNDQDMLRRPQRQGSIVFVWYLLCLLVPLSLAQSVSARSLPDFTELVEENSNAVVNISTTTEPKSANRGRSNGLPFNDRQLEQLPDRKSVV